MKKVSTVWLFSIAMSVLLIPFRANATITEADNVVMVPYALSQAENGASMVVAYSPTMTVCGGGIFYIAPEDRHILATFLSAQISSTHVDFRYQDSATSVTI